MAANDIFAPDWFEPSKAAPNPFTFVCDAHGTQEFVLRFNRDNNRVVCSDCMETGNIPYAPVRTYPTATGHKTASVQGG